MIQCSHLLTKIFDCLINKFVDNLIRGKGEHPGAKTLAGGGLWTLGIIHCQALLFANPCRIPGHPAPPVKYADGSAKLAKKLQYTNMDLSADGVRAESRTSFFLILIS
jgi:hypothetical protein